MTAAKPISVQLYSLREESVEDFDAVLERLAAIGYAGVEPFALFGKSPEAFKAQVEGLGMKVSSSHHPWANRTAIGEVVDTVGGLGLTRAAGGFGPDDFADLDAVKRTADTVNGLVDALAPHGIELFLHNHWWEFSEIDGKLGFQHIVERCPGVHFEVDTYWAANFGRVDVAEVVAGVKERAPLLHIKDGPLEEGKAHVAVGDGRMDIAGVIAAADPSVLEWLIVELDACDTDMMTAVEGSHRYLTGNGLAAGRAV
jgi:sugar phosphate isomerase/epimerase